LGTGHLRPRVALLAAMLVAAWAALGDNDAGAAMPPELSQQAAGLADAISVDWSHSLNAAGSIVDPVTGQVEGGYGRTFLANGMLRAELRDPALDLTAVVAHALQNPGAVGQAPFKLLGLAETLLSAGGALSPELTAALQQAALSYPPYGSSSSTAPCFQRADCYDNLKLVSATGVLATLAAVPGQAGPPGSTFASPLVAATQARALLASTIPAVEIPDATLRLGSVALAGAVLSDPTRDAPAYLALSAMLLGRALELTAPVPPLALQAFQRAIVALLGLTAPDGNISYMGRGQGQVWTMASAAAACALALRLLPSARFISSRCEGLIDSELGALATRRSLGGLGIAAVPRLTWSRGVDRYVNRTDYNGLTVYALNLTADALSGLPDSGEQPLPGAESAESFVDANGSGLATTSLHGLWFAVHRLDSNPADSRWGFGLMAMERLEGDHWISELTDRPLGPGVQGPTLLLHGHAYNPIGQSLQVAPGRIVIRGGWGAGNHLVRRATFVYQATAQGVVLTLPVERGDVLTMREWTLPGETGSMEIGGSGGQEVVTRVAAPAGNDVSNTVELVRHLVKVPSTDTYAVRWQDIAVSRHR
jgi:hypothetical protein